MGLFRLTRAAATTKVTATTNSQPRVPSFRMFCGTPVLFSRPFQPLHFQRVGYDSRTVPQKNMERWDIGYTGRMVWPETRFMRIRDVPIYSCERTPLPAAAFGA